MAKHFFVSRRFRGFSSLPASTTTQQQIVQRTVAQQLMAFNWISFCNSPRNSLRYRMADHGRVGRRNFPRKIKFRLQTFAHNNCSLGETKPLAAELRQFSSKFSGHKSPGLFLPSIHLLRPSRCWWPASRNWIYMYFCVGWSLWNV